MIMKAALKDIGGVIKVWIRQWRQLKISEKMVRDIKQKKIY